MKLLRKWLGLSAACLACIALGQAPQENLEDIARELGQLFRGAIQQSDGQGRKKFYRRPVFAKTHGCVTADFIVNPHLQEDYKVGIFGAKPSYKAWIRFSNDSGFGPDTVTDPKNGAMMNPARGMAIKVVGVPGNKLLDIEPKAFTQDFLMQNHDIFFVDTAVDFRNMITKGESAQATKILTQIRKKLMSNPLDGQYWIPVPIALGEKHSMKYTAKPEPCEDPCPSYKCPLARVPLADKDAMKGKHYLRANMDARLKKPGMSCFGFWVQLFENDKSTPLDKATVRWETKFERFATIKIKHLQDINDKDREWRCEGLSYSVWHATKELEPLGTINAVRKFVYRAMAGLRRGANANTHLDVPSTEPTEVVEEFKLKSN